MLSQAVMLTMLPALCPCRFSLCLFTQITGCTVAVTHGWAALLGSPEHVPTCSALLALSHSVCLSTNIVLQHHGMAAAAVAGGQIRKGNGKEVVSRKVKRSQIRKPFIFHLSLKTGECAPTYLHSFHTKELTVLKRNAKIHTWAERFQSSETAWLLKMFFKSNTKSYNR